MTSITGPYDDHPRDDVRRLQTAIPTAVADDLLNRMFPAHGFQDRMLATLVYLFYHKCLAAGIPREYTTSNETAAKAVLNELLSQLNKPTTTHVNNQS